MNELSKIGLHLRIGKTLTELVQQAIDYRIAYAQFFLTADVKHARYIKPDTQDCQLFNQMRQQHVSHLYIHSSYWINPAAGNPLAQSSSYKNLKREVTLAKKVGAHAIVIHPGSASGYAQNNQDLTNKHAGIQSIAALLTPVAQQNPDIEFLLENTTHAHKSIGSDLHDFVLLRQALAEIKNINFCLDIAHAFSYGYDIQDINGFVRTLDQTMGLNRIKLIHLNDTQDTCGSKKDNHALPGNGQIGLDTLQKYYNLPIFKDIPKILELPVSTPEQIKQTLELFL